ncbi:arginyltransferase [Ranunculus cassubicifolius]
MAENGASSSNRSESVVADVGKRRSSCGYCRSTGRSSVSHGLWANSMTADDYQDLLDQGWRRSGCFLYKPEMETTCCPSYTIRLKAGDFLPAKEQLRVSRRMQRFLDGTFDGNKAVPTDESNISDSKENLPGNSENKNNEEHPLLILSQQIDNAVGAWSATGEYAPDLQFPKASVKKVIHAKKKLIKELDDLMYSSNISFQIAAVLKRSKVTEKPIKDSGLSKSDTDLNGQSSEIVPTTIAEKLVSLLNKEENPLDLTIRACNGHINFHSSSKQVSSGQVYEPIKDSSQSRKAVRGKRSSNITNSSYPQKKRRKLEIRLRRSTFDPEEYALYKRYQIKVHNDKEDHVQESSYRRFLVDTPIIYVPPSGDNTVPPCGFGSFHQQYIIDGKLVAVGVVDILPRCLSSKYLFWDPDLAFLSLGKYSALQEISWVKENEVHCPSLQHYYLGYYIHSCKKMRYKAAYQPSELLCPLRYQWVPFDIARPLLDKKPYVILSDFANLQNESSSPHHDIVKIHKSDPSGDMVESGSDEDEQMMEPNFEGSEEEDSETETISVNEILSEDVSNVMMGFKDTRLRYKELIGAFGPTDSVYLSLQLQRYQKAVGPVLSERMVYSLG